MSAAIAMAPSPAPHDRTSFGGSPPAAVTSSNAAGPAPASVSPSAHRTAISATPSAPAPPAPQQYSNRSGSGSPKGQAQGAAKSSPPSASRTGGGPPRIIVKKEPGSPDLTTARHRPRRLDLSRGGQVGSGAATARPLGSRESGLGIQEMGLACLSPGFVTQDPIMKEQVQRSLSVREQQRHLIEARLQQQSAKGDGPSDKDKEPHNGFAAKTPGMSRRNKAPPGLSIVAPSHENFANERVIQSAPLGQTFTGMNNPHPLTRHIENRPSKLSNTSHIHHVPATQTNNRLPPISDVFGHNLHSGHPESTGHAMYAQHQNGPQPIRSPGHTHNPHPPPSATRPREYKSAEEAQHELAGGRPELLPKLVHYGGHQPPTPPSPLPPAHRVDASRSTSTTKRRRDEYEAGVSPPLGNGRPSVRRGPFGEGRDSPETQRAKREEFLRICERAWDLFHS